MRMIFPALVMDQREEDPFYLGGAYACMSVFGNQH